MKQTLGQAAVASWPEDEARLSVRHYCELREDCGQEEALRALRDDMRHVAMIFDTEEERVRYAAAVLAEVPEVGRESLAVQEAREKVKYWHRYVAMHGVRYNGSLAQAQAELAELLAKE